jgi:hypothetical protein
MIDNIKTFGKLIEFEDWFVRNGFYSKYFEEIKELGNGSFGKVFMIKIKEDSDDFKEGFIWRESEYSAIKRIEFTSVKKMK